MYVYSYIAHEVLLLNNYVTAVRRVVASSSLTQSLKGIATAGMYNRSNNNNSVLVYVMVCLLLE